MYVKNRERKVYFYGSIEDISKPILRGGQRVTMQMAEALCNFELGYRPFIVYKSSLIKKMLYRNTNKLFISESEFKDEIDVKNDIVVIPGRYINAIDSIYGLNKIIFSQGAFITLNSIELNECDFFNHPTVKTVFCVSEGNARLLKFITNKPICTIQNFVFDKHKDINFFKEKIVVYPSLKSIEKNFLDTKAILHIINAKMAQSPFYDKFQLVELHGYSFEDVQKILNKAMVLLFLGINEGLPHLMLEAMCHSVIPIGYNRKSISDFLHPKCAFEINQIEDIANTVVNILNFSDDWKTVSAWVRKKVETLNYETYFKSIQDAFITVENEIHKTTL